MPTPTPTHVSSPAVAVSSVPQPDVLVPSVSPTNVASTGSPAVPSVSPTGAVSSTETTSISTGMSSNVSSIVFDCFCLHVVQCRRNHLVGRGSGTWHLIYYHWRYIMCTNIGKRASPPNRTAGDFHMYVCILWSLLPDILFMCTVCHDAHLHIVYFPAVQLGGFTPLCPQCFAFM